MVQLHPAGKAVYIARYFSFRHLNSMGAGYANREHRNRQISYSRSNRSVCLRSKNT